MFRLLFHITMYMFFSFVRIMITYSCLSWGTRHHFGQLPQYNSVSMNLLHSLIDKVSCFLLKLILFFELLIVLSLLFIGGIERNPGRHLHLQTIQYRFYLQLNITLKINFPLYTIMSRVLRIKWI